MEQILTPIPSIPANIFTDSPPKKGFEFVNQAEIVTMSMRACTEGFFWMGHKADMNAPLQYVEVRSPFEIATHLVCQGFWEDLFGDNPSNWLGRDLPVERVSWLEAIIFCNKISLHLNLEPCYVIADGKIFFDGSKKGYRLPFEAEWEYAAKAPNPHSSEASFVYAGSDDYADVANIPLKNKSNHTWPVGSKKPNAWGLYDMTGNLNEWCNDLFNSNHYQKYRSYKVFDVSQAFFTIDLQALNDFSKLNCVVKGGSWFNSPEYSKVHTRTSQNIMYPSSMVGIRLARTI
jgi:formylglycine-generating enzyme required for sulfatase activity